MGGIEAVVFDIGATLVYGSEPPAKRLAGILSCESRRKEIDDIIMLNDFNDSGELVTRLESWLGLTFSEAEIIQVYQLWQEQLAGCKELGPSGQVLRALRGRGLKTAVVSDIWRPYYECAKSVLNLESLTDVRKLSFQTGKRKPALDNFEVAIAELGVSPDKAVMVGDDYAKDIEPAMKCGMKTVWLLSRPENELKNITGVIKGIKSKPDCVAESLHDLLSWIMWQDVRDH